MDLKELAKPFPAEDIEWRVQRAGEKNGKIWAMVLAYVTNRAIMARLDDVCGPENWQNDYKLGPSGGNLCGISIYIAERKEWVTKWDGADNTQIEGTKGGLSDAMKRAGYQWGIGRYLYKLDTGFANIHEKGAISTSAKIDGNNKYFKYDPPALPAWALPGATQAQNQAVKPTKQDEAPLAQKKPTEDCIPDNIKEMEKPELLILVGKLTKEFPTYMDGPLEKTGLKGMAAGDMTKEKLLACIDRFNVEIVK